MKFTKKHINFDHFHLRLSEFFCNLIQHSTALTFLALLCSFFSFATQLPAIYIVENTSVVGFETIFQNTPKIYVVENSIVSGLSDYQLIKVGFYDKNKGEQTKAKPEVVCVSKTISNNRLFNKTQPNNKLICQTIGAVAAVVSNPSKSQFKKVILIYNHPLYSVGLQEAKAQPHFYIPPPQYQNSKTYTLLCYFPPPSPSPQREISLPNPSHCFIFRNDRRAL